MAKIVPYLPIAIEVMIASRFGSIVLLDKVAPGNYKARKVTLFMLMTIVSFIALLP